MLEEVREAVAPAASSFEPTWYQMFTVTIGRAVVLVENQLEAVRKHGFFNRDRGRSGRGGTRTREGNQPGHERENAALREKLHADGLHALDREFTMETYRNARMTWRASVLR